jgi:hypothetical protein
VVMAFTGIPAEAFDFYDGLVADNSRIYWGEHKHEYQKFVKEPLIALATELGPEFGEAHMYRPYRDLRFGKDKTPYKDHQGMFVESKNGLGWYLQLSGAGVMIAGGWYMSAGFPGGQGPYRHQIARLAQPVARISPTIRRIGALTPSSACLPNTSMCSVSLRASGSRLARHGTTSSDLL